MHLRFFHDHPDHFFAEGVIQWHTGHAHHVASEVGDEPFLTIDRNDADNFFRRWQTKLLIQNNFAREIAFIDLCAKCPSEVVDLFVVFPLVLVVTILFLDFCSEALAGWLRQGLLSELPIN